MSNSIISAYFQVAPVLPITQSSGVAVTTILIILVIIGIVAGLAYYVLKHKNDAFRFQYFKVRFRNDTYLKIQSVTSTLPCVLYCTYNCKSHNYFLYVG